MALTSRLELEVDSRNAEQDVLNVRKGLEALEEQGIETSLSMNKAGAEMAGMGVDADKATKSVKQQRAELEQLLGSLDPVRKRQNELAKAQGELAAAFSRGDINEAGYKQFSGIIRDQVTTLNQSKTAINEFNAGLSRTGMSAKATAAAMRGVPAQITDIVVSLQGGQAPLTVLLQQGGQLKDMFGGVVPAAKALGSSVVALINPFTIAAAAAATLGAAYYKGWSESDNYRKALLLTGNAAGLSSNQLSDMASAIGNSVGTTSSAAAALAGLASSGKIATGSFEAVTTAALKLKENTGKAVEDTVAEFVKIGEDPVAAAKSLNDQYNFLTTSVYTQIKSMQEQGDTVGAVTLLTTTYANTISGRTGEMTQNLGYIEQAWRKIKDVSAEALSAAANIGREQTLSQQRVDLQAKLNALEEKSKNNLVARSGFVTKERDALKAQLNIIDLQIDGEQTLSKYLGDRARIQREGIDAASRRLKIEEDGQTKAQKLNKALEKANSDINKEREAGSIITAEQEEALYKTIRERSEFQEKAAKKERAYTEDAGTKALDEARKRYAVLQEQNTLIDTQGIGSQKLGAEAQKLIAWEQQLADIKGKQTLTSDQKSLLASADLYTAQLKRNAALEKENALRKTANDEAQKLLAFQENLQSQLKTAQSGLDSNLVGIGAGDLQQQRLKEQFSIQQSYQAQLDRLTYDYNKGDKTAGSTALYDKQSEALRQALEKRLAMQSQYYTDVDALQSDWTVGASSAFQTYQEQAANVAAQTRSLFTNAFGGMEDAVVKFVRTGKLSFKDFANGVIEDLIRIQVRQAAAGFLSTAFSAFSGIGGGAGTTSSALGASAAGYSSQYGFSDGGFTGEGGKFEPKGVVHGGEFVVKKEVVSQPGMREYLERMNSNTKGYADGGYVSPTTTAATGKTLSSSSSGSSMPAIHQTITVRGSADADTLARIQQAAQKGAQDGYNLVLRDLKSNGPARQLIARR